MRNLLVCLTAATALISLELPLLAEAWTKAPSAGQTSAKGNSQQITSPEQTPEGLSKPDWQSIRAAHKAWEHSFMPMDKGGWQARNPGQQWTTKFDGQGFVTQPKAADWKWGLELRSYGFGREQRSVTGQPVLKAAGQRLTYQWDADMQEWFVNDARGLEHGFTLARRPEGAFGVALDVVLGTRGSLKPHVAVDAQTVYFRDAAGAPVVTYAGLKVWDADGQVLPSHFVVGPEGVIILRVEEGTARYPLTIDPIAQQAYLKPGSESLGFASAGDGFGHSVAVSGDTVVVGVFLEDSSSTGINSTPDEAASASGAVYVFVRSGATWSQQAYLKASQVNANDQFGLSVSISGDTLVVGARSEDSSTTGINSSPDEAASDAGAAYVFVRSGTTWSQQAYLKASQFTPGDQFGISVSVSGDTVVVGAFSEDSSTTGVNSSPDEAASNAGAAYVFVRSGMTWSQQAYLKASQVSVGDQFGCSVAVSGDTVVVGAQSEGSGTTGVNSTPNESAGGAGAAYVFVRSGSDWSQQAYLKASQVSGGDQFGGSVAVSGDTVVVGAEREDSSTTGINRTPNESASLSGAAYVFVRNDTTWSQQAYLKASQVTAGDTFGCAVAISGDTVVVGAQSEDSGTTGINSTPNESAGEAGAAYVFVRSGTTWTQQAYLKAAQVSAGDWFGGSVAVSGDTVVVGAPFEDSSTSGINSVPNELGSNSGAAYVYVRSGTTWSQQAYVKPDSGGPGYAASGDEFGGSVAVSCDTVVVGAMLEDSSSTGINSTPDEGAPNSGAVYVYVRSGGTWTQQAYLKAAQVSEGDWFGSSVAVSGDTVVIGAVQEDSSTTGINSTPDESALNAGATYVFVRSGTTWSQQAYLKANQVTEEDLFGGAVAVSGDTVVVGAQSEDSGTTGINSTPSEGAQNSGAAYVFVRSGTTWSQQAYLKAAQVSAGDLFGGSVAVSGDTVVVGAYQEDSNTTGIDTTPNESATNAGAAYVFARSGTTWSQQAYLKASQVSVGDRFGISVAVSGDTLLVGAPSEDSGTTGINSTPSEGASNSGAAYVFVRSGMTWSQQAYLKASQVTAGDFFGHAVAISGDTVVVGAYLEDSSTTGINSTPDQLASDAGAAYVFVRNGTIWSQQAYLKASQVTLNDWFGTSVAVSGDTVVVGVSDEDSSAVGINGSANERALDAGAAYIFSGFGPVFVTPTLTGVSPATGSLAGGTSVMITGTGFAGATDVTFGGIAASSFSVVSDTMITAVTPAGTAGVASVLVTTPGGTNAANTAFTYLSSNADLAALILSRGALTPGFSSGTTAYTASVPHAVDSVTVRPFAADSGATLTVNGTPLASGTVSSSLPLSVGPNVITTLVTAADNATTRSYEITVTRAAAPVGGGQGPAFEEFIDPNPSPGNLFGHSVVALSTGNVVITSPYDDAGGTDAGAAYLFNGATGALISTVTGSTPNDNVGFNGVVALATGNFVINTSDWNNAGVIDSGLGAVTFGNGVTGVSGVVSAANSLVGTTTGDNVGRAGVTALTNGNYVVCSSLWNNGTIISAGAVTFGNGTTGVVGPVTTANSLHGTEHQDFVGTGRAIALSNGNYVVVSSFWHGTLGAVTLVNGLTGMTGPVTVANSLVGSTLDDFVGREGVTALSNGNFVVNSRAWHHEGTVNAGAVTFVNGTTGLTGPVTTANSLHGTSVDDSASRSVVALTNGNYVVSSSYWDDGGISNVGAVTFGNGSNGIVGPVTTANSLHGSTAGDRVGGEVVPLSGGNYVVASSSWTNGAQSLAGASTWANGTTGISGPVTTSNSLYGTVASDDVGSGIMPLTNGNFVVISPRWNNGVLDARIGAVTWGDGATGLTGPVSTTNSLHGSTTSDFVNATVTSLTNGNYVVSLASWDDAGIFNAGAAVFANGSTGIVGPVTTANSLHGTMAGEFSPNVIPLTNGNYVVSSLLTNVGAIIDAGTVTFGNGATGITGAVTPANSLHGRSNFDLLGVGFGSFAVKALSNGNYVISSRFYSDSGLSRVGAFTFGNGTTGSFGPATASNSLFGKQANTGNGLREVVEDTVNKHFFGRFLFEDNGKVRVGSTETGVAPPAMPEITLTGNSVEIISGDVTPSLTDHTDFGTTNVMGGTVSRLFTVTNTGTAALNLTGSPVVKITGANGADFTVVATPSTPLPPLTGVSTFEIEFDPSGVGLRSALITVESDDTDEPSYTFAIQGQGGAAGAPIITDGPYGGTYPVYEPILLEVTVTGTAPFNYQWSKDGEEIDGARGSTHSFTLTRETAGSYTVVVSNSEGSATSGPAVLEVETRQLLRTDDELPAVGFAGAQLYRPLSGVIGPDGSFVLQALSSVGAGGISAANDQLIVTNRSGDLEVIGQEGQTVGSGTMSRLFYHLNTRGTSAAYYRAVINGGSSLNDTAYFISPDGQSLEILSQEGDEAPEGSLTFTGHLSPPAISQSGIVYFDSKLMGSGVTPKNDTGVWFDQDGDQGTVVREGDRAPTGSSVADQAWYGQILAGSVVAGDQAVSFIAELQGDPLNATHKTDGLRNAAIITGTAGEVSVVARKADVIAGLSVRGFNAVSASRDGGHAFVSPLTQGGAVNSSNALALFYKPAVGAPVLVAQKGQSLPDTGVINVFERLFAASGGQVIFEVTLNNSTSFDNALCRWTAAEGIEVLMQEGDVAAGGGIYGALRSITVSGNGKLMIQDSRAVWRDGGEGLELVLKTGDTVPYGEVFRTALSLAINDETVNTRRAGGGFGGMINDDGVVLVIVSVGNGEYTTQILP